MLKQICVYDQKIPETTVGIADPAILDELRHEKIEASPGLLLSSSYRVIAGDITHTRAFQREPAGNPGLKRHNWFRC